MMPASVSAEPPGGLTASTAFQTCVPETAAIVVEVKAVTELVAMAKLAVVAAAGTVTLSGTVAAALLLESFTSVPPAGAAAFSVTLPVVVLPPTTLAGLTASSSGGAGSAAPDVTSIGAVTVRLQQVAVMVAEAVAATALVAMLKVAVKVPAGIVTLAGTVATAVLLLRSVTSVPNGLKMIVRVPVAEPPPTTLFGMTLTVNGSGSDGGGGGWTVRMPLEL